MLRWRALLLMLICLLLPLRGLAAVCSACPPSGHSHEHSYGHASGFADGPAAGQPGAAQPAATPGAQGPHPPRGQQTHAAWGVQQAHPQHAAHAAHAGREAHGAHQAHEVDGGQSHAGQPGAQVCQGCVYSLPAAVAPLPLPPLPAGARFPALTLPALTFERAGPERPPRPPAAVAALPGVRLTA